MQDIALEYARKGFYVFPRYKTSKGPVSPYGWARNNPSKDIDKSKIIPASNDPNYVKIWGKLIADGYNSTVHSFGVLGIGCIILDLDVKNGVNGVDEFEALKQKLGFPSPELVVKSKSGGLHLYYAKPADQAQLEIKTLASITFDRLKYPGVDIRGDGGFVVGPTIKGGWTPGEYAVIKGSISTPLSEAPHAFVSAFAKSTFTQSSDLESLIQSSSAVGDEDVMSKLKRGEIPECLPAGQRNDGFFTFISALRNKGFTKETTLKMVDALIAVTENSETLRASVDVDEMLERLYTINIDNPYDVCRDLYNFGLYRLTSYKSKIHYIMISQNPYINSKGLHDLTAMKQLLCKYERNVQQSDGRMKLVSPAALIDYTVPSDHDVATLAFKPGAGQVFSNSHSSNMLNIWQDPRSSIVSDPDADIWAEFIVLVTRLFGPEGSKEYELGLDFLAWIIQKPGVKPSISPFLMSSKRGVGKSLFMSIVMMLCGENHLGESQSRPFKINEISGRFFDPSRSSVLAFDEVQFPVHRDMRKKASDFWTCLKNLITSSTFPVEIKGGDTFHLPNLGSVIMAGNSGGHFPVEEFDRRIWIIDNEAPLLEKGTCDTLFRAQINDVVKEKVRGTLLTMLNRRTIKSDLSMIRAPMTAIKHEMYLATLDRLSEWFVVHFENDSNVLARTPILTKSAVIYLIETDELLANTNYSEDSELAFRELKRSGMLRPVRTKNNPGISRSVQSMRITRTGEIIESDKRSTIYTSRDHGDYNAHTNESLIQLYTQNIHTVRRWRDNMVAARKRAAAGV